MMRLLPLLALVAALWLESPPEAAVASQSLSINFHGDGARATQLPQYDPSQPIDVRVKEASGERVDAVRVVSAGPNGELFQTPLNRDTDGSFGGTLLLQKPGPWRVRLTASAGAASTETSAVLLDVEVPPPSSSWQMGLAVAAAIFVVGGGGGFLILRRIIGSSDARQPQLARVVTTRN